MSKLVSIIIPVYNENPIMLNMAIRSILEQTYNNIELIVIDDGSDNNSVMETVESFNSHKNFNKIKAIYKEHSGISRTFNKGIEISNGDIIGFLGSDDIHYPHKIEKQLAQWDHEKYMWSFTGYISVRINEKNSNQATRNSFGTNLFYKYGFSNDCRPINENIINAVPALRELSFNTILFHKNIINKIGKFDNALPFAHDLDFIMKLCTESDCWTIEENLTICRDYEKPNHRIETHTNKRGYYDLTIICNKLYNSLQNGSYSFDNNIITIPFSEIQYGTTIKTNKAIVAIDIKTRKPISVYGNKPFIDKIKNTLTQDMITELIGVHQQYNENSKLSD